MNKDELKTILEIALDKSKYARLEKDKPVYLSEHPITGERRPGGWYFHGTVGNTSSIEPMQKAVIEAIAEGDEVGSITWHCLVQYNGLGEKIGHHLVVEVEMVAGDAVVDRHMCSGMTDYSGTGGGGLNRMREFVSILFDTYNPTMNELLYRTPESFDVMSSKVNQAAKEQTEDVE